MIAVVFPGQGSQTVGMGADLAAAYPAAKNVFDQADAVLGVPLSRLCFEGPADQLTATEMAQPALLTCGYAAWLLAREALGPVACTAGHSLGEYTALVAVGALSFEAALRLVRRRGELMRDAAAAHPGAMAAILNLDDETVARLCDETPGVVVPANYNAPGQVVVSGAEAAVEAVCEAAKEAGGRGRKLPVSGAFHSPFMAPAAEGLAAALEAVEFADAAVPVVQNVTGEPVTAADELRRNLTAQVTGSVRWTKAMATLAAAGVTRVVELGPGKVLTGLFRRGAPELAGYNVDGVEALAGLGAWMQDGAAGD